MFKLKNHQLVDGMSTPPASNDSMDIRGKGVNVDEMLAAIPSHVLQSHLTVGEINLCDTKHSNGSSMLSHGISKYDVNATLNNDWLLANRCVDVCEKIKIIFKAVQSHI